MYRYQPFYCEENVWQLCRAAADRGDGDLWAAVFISNADRTVACWEQRAAPKPGEPIVWDYHVVALAWDEKSGFRVHDADCTAGSELAAQAWVAVTFPHGHRVVRSYRPRFRVIAAPLWLDAFATDRSHMRGPAGVWFKPPPPWDPPGAPHHNLMTWVDTDSGAPTPGQCFDLQGFIDFCAGRAFSR